MICIIETRLHSIHILTEILFLLHLFLNFNFFYFPSIELILIEN